MTLMAVAYANCGCRVSVLLDAHDKEQLCEFVHAAKEEGWSVRFETHAEIGAKPCLTHEVDA